MNVYICAAKRTPIGSYGKAFKDVIAADLGKVAAKAAVEQSGIDMSAIDETIAGCVLQGGIGQNIARQIALGIGMPLETPAMTINKVCASSMRALNLSSQIIRSGDDQCILAGGAESMSNAPYTVAKAR